MNILKKLKFVNLICIKKEKKHKYEEKNKQH